MAWNFRRRARLGPLNVNLSKSGVGWSVGVPGFRVGRSTRGQQYSQTSIPGTGIYRRDSYNALQSQQWRGWSLVVIVAAMLLGLLHC
jgi:hypothetical protein